MQGKGKGLMVLGQAKSFLTQVRGEGILSKDQGK